MHLPDRLNAVLDQVLLEPADPGPRAAQRVLASALMLAYVSAYVFLGYVQFYHWTITTGLLFVVLWRLPRRWWPAVFLATIFARLIGGIIGHELSGISGPFLGYWAGPLQMVLGNVLEPFLVVVGVLALRRWGVLPGLPVTARGIALLHIAAALSALAVVGKDLAYVLNAGFIADVRRAHIYNPVPIGDAGSWELLLAFAIKNFLGAFVGILLVAPIALWLAAPTSRAGSFAILRAGLRYLVPVAAAFVLLGTHVHGQPLAELLRQVLLVALVVFAMRHGWRGASLSILAVSLAIAVDEHLGQVAVNPIWMQLFIAITGAMALLFGATVDEYQQQAKALALARNVQADLARQLRDVAQRNLHMEERERRRLANELHDEFGQNLAALQTHLKLVEPEFARVGRLPAIDTLTDITRAMRQNISRVLDALRPASLDELGLYGAIDRGSIRRLLEDSGVAFELDLQGDARQLGEINETYRTAAYRLVQEATTNSVRHARASRFTVRLRINRRAGFLYLVLDMRDDGIGLAGAPRFGNGLQGMHDRIQALNGSLSLRSLQPGLRLHVLLRQPV